MVILGVDPGWENCGVTVLEVIDAPYEYCVLDQRCINLGLKKSDPHQKYAEQIHAAFASLPDGVQCVGIESGDAGGEVLKKLVTAMASYFWHRYRCRVAVIAPRSNRAAWKLTNHKNRTLNKEESLARWASATTVPKIVTDHEAEAAFLAVVAYLYQGSRKPKRFSVDISQCRIMTERPMKATPAELKEILALRPDYCIEGALQACKTWEENAKSYMPVKFCPYCACNLGPKMNLCQAGPNSTRPGEMFQKCQSVNYNADWSDGNGCGNFFSYLGGEAPEWMATKKIPALKKALEAAQQKQPEPIQAARTHHVTQENYPVEDDESTQEYVDVCGDDDDSTDDEWDGWLNRFAELEAEHQKAQKHIRELRGFIEKKKKYAGERKKKLSRAARGREFQPSEFN